MIASRHEATDAVGVAERVRRRMWAAIILTWVSSIAVADEPAPSGSEFQGDLNQAVQLIFAGKGGYGGIGLGKMWPRLSIPALSGEQIRTALVGNTISNAEALGAYFNPEGSIEAWFVNWMAPPGKSKCPVKEIRGDAWRLLDGACRAKEIVPVRGAWRVDDNQMCVELAWDTSASGNIQAGTEKECWYVALVLDQIAFFHDSGAITSNGKRLLRGRALEQVVE